MVLADWLVHEAVPGYLEAVELNDHASVFRQSQPATQKTLGNGRVLWGKLSYVDGIIDDLYDIYSAEHNELPDEVREKWLPSSSCYTSGMRIESFEARLAFGKSTMGRKLRMICSISSAILLIRNNWEWSEEIYLIHDDILRKEYS